MNAHDKAVNEFLKQCKNKDPARYKEVCDRHPVLSPYQWQRVHEREISFTTLTSEDLARLGLEGATNDEA